MRRSSIYRPKGWLLSTLSVRPGGGFWAPLCLVIGTRMLLFLQQGLGSVVPTQGWNPFFGTRTRTSTLIGSQLLMFVQTLIMTPWGFLSLFRLTSGPGLWRILARRGNYPKVLEQGCVRMHIKRALYKTNLNKENINKYKIGQLIGTYGHAKRESKYMM